MKALVLGQGGREAAIAWKLALSPKTSKVVVAPGNPGMSDLSSKISISSDLLENLLLETNFDLVVVGPENLLADGIADKLRKLNLPVVGPDQYGAQLESSKIFSKKLMQKLSIPTAEFACFSSPEEARTFIDQKNWTGFVIKADGLAQGKGVIVTSKKETAKLAVDDMFSENFLGKACENILIEERLYGKEISAFALCDGETFSWFGSACDYKQLQDNDEGPNTGGMGCFSPVPWLTPDMKLFIEQKVFSPIIQEMKKIGHPFVGFLFAGLMVTKDGAFLLEFNTRLGDPETQTLLPLIEDDLFDLFLRSATGKLGDHKVKLSQHSCVHVVMSAAGYPGVYQQEIKKGDAISLKEINTSTYFFPAGVSKNASGLITSGGRVLGISAVGTDLEDARMKAYAQIENVHFNGKHFRKDIGRGQRTL